MKEDSQLYFVAIVPDNKTVEEISILKDLFSENYNSKASLNSLSHITLHMPFWLRDKKMDSLIKLLSRIAEESRDFGIQLKGFGSFPPKAIFLEVEENDKLNKLQNKIKTSFRRELKLMNSNYKDQAFHPHITLAFRDLSKENYQKAWAKFKDQNFEGKFNANALLLLKHDGKRWEKDREFPFKF